MVGDYICLLIYKCSIVILLKLGNVAKAYKGLSFNPSLTDLPNDPVRLHVDSAIVRVTLIQNCYIAPCGHNCDPSLRTSFLLLCVNFVPMNYKRPCPFPRTIVFHHFSVAPTSSVCVCVCVCERERERNVDCRIFMAYYGPSIIPPSSRSPQTPLMMMMRCCGHWLNSWGTRTLSFLLVDQSSPTLCW